MADSRFTRTASVGCLLLLPAAIATGSEQGGAARRLLDLSPERVAAFQQALRDFGGIDGSAGGDFYFQARYEPVLAGPARQPGMLRANAEDLESIRVPYGRDLLFEENFLIAGREDEYLSAAKSWASRTIKGSDVASATSHHATRVRYAWNDGPTVGVGRGPFSARLGWDGDWRIRYSRSLPAHPGWMMRAWVGVNDGEEVVGFSLGRSLLASTRRK